MRPTRPSRRRAQATAAALLAAVAVAGSFDTPVRALLVRLEPVAPPALFLLALVLGALSLAPRRFARHGRRAEAALGRTLRIVGMPALALLFVMPVWAAWDQQPTGSASAIAALGGRIPHLDAASHLEGALRLLAAGEFNDSSARRPLHACWLAVRLGLDGGSLAGALVLQAALLGLAVGVAARVVAVRYGIASTLVFVALLLGLVRDYLAAVLTEPLGVMLAALGLAAILDCLTPRPTGSRPWPPLGALAAGVWIADLAAHARPGAQFLGPAIGLWAALQARGRRVLTTAVVVGCLGANALVTATLNSAYGPPRASFSSYPAYTLYGLVAGSNYQGAESEHRAALEALPDEHARSRYLYRQVWRRFVSDPLALPATLADNALRFVSKLVPNLSRVSDPAMLAVDPREPFVLPAYMGWTHLLLGLPILLLCTVGAALRLRRRGRRAEDGLWSLMTVAVLGSAAFIYGDAGFRGLAAGYPAVAALLALGVTPRRRIAAVRVHGVTKVAALAALAFVAACLVGPAILGRKWPRPAHTVVTSEGLRREHVVRIDGASPFLVVWNTPPPELAPWSVNRKQFNQAIERGAANNIEELRSLDPPVVLVSVFDHASGRLVQLASEPGILQSRGRFLHVTGWSSGTLTHVTGWTPLATPPR